MCITADEQSICHPARPRSKPLQTMGIKKEINVQHRLNAETCLTYGQTTVVTVLTDGGPYVSADDVPEQAEIHPLTELRWRLDCAKEALGSGILLSLCAT